MRLLTFVCSSTAISLATNFALIPRTEAYTCFEETSCPCKQLPNLSFVRLAAIHYCVIHYCALCIWIVGDSGCGVSGSVACFCGLWSVPPSSSTSSRCCSSNNICGSGPSYCNTSSANDGWCVKHLNLPHGYLCHNLIWFVNLWMAGVLRAPGTMWKKHVTISQLLHQHNCRQ